MKLGWSHADLQNTKLFISKSLDTDTRGKHSFCSFQKKKEQCLPCDTLNLFWSAKNPMEGKTKFMVWKTELWDSVLIESDSNRIAEGCTACLENSWNCWRWAEAQQKTHMRSSYFEAFEFFHIHTMKTKWKLQCRVISAKALKKLLFFNRSQKHLTKVQKEPSCYLSFWCCGPHSHSSCDLKLFKTQDGEGGKFSFYRCRFSKRNQFQWALNAEEGIALSLTAARGARSSGDSQPHIALCWFLRVVKSWHHSHKPGYLTSRVAFT